MAGVPELSLSLWLPPVPASRPRVTRWGTYYTKTYKTWMTLAEAVIPSRGLPPLEGPLEVSVRFDCYRPKATKLDIPKGDIDNYLKSILDVLTKRGYWLDDKQIVAVTATKQFHATRPATHIEVAQADHYPYP